MRLARQIRHAILKPFHRMNVAPTMWLESALGLIYPDVCQLCDERRAKVNEGLVCSECQRNVRFIVPPFCERCGLPFDGKLTTVFTCTNCRDLELHFTTARAAVSTQGITLEIIHRFKYQRALWFEPLLADLLLRQALPALRSGNWDLIVPVPLHATKLREREFNQAARLANHLGRALQLPVAVRTLKRTRPTRTQTLLTRQQRAENMHNAFAVRSRDGLAGKRIVLVDDVLTTGATTNACAKALRAAGAAEVCVWTVARGL